MVDDAHVFSLEDDRQSEVPFVGRRLPRLASPKFGNPGWSNRLFGTHLSRVERGGTGPMGTPVGTGGDSPALGWLEQARKVGRKCRVQTT